MAVESMGRVVQLDDLEPCRVYHFRLRGGFIRGPFQGFIRKRGEPLVVMVTRSIAREVLSFPVSELREIREAS